MREVGIVPVRGRLVSGGVQKARVLLNRYLRCRHGKGIEADAMNGAFYSLTGVGSHGERASCDLNSQRFSDRHSTGS